MAWSRMIWTGANSKSFDVLSMIPTYGIPLFCLYKFSWRRKKWNRNLEPWVLVLALLLLCCMTLEKLLDISAPSPMEPRCLVSQEASGFAQPQRCDPLTTWPALRALQNHIHCSTVGPNTQSLLSHPQALSLTDR